MPIPSDRPGNVARFEPIIGRWRTEGRIVGDGTPVIGWDTYELLPGGHFIVHHVDVHVGDQPVQAIEIIGEHVGATDRLLARAYDNDGAVTLMSVDIDEHGVWRFAGGADVAPAARPDLPVDARAAVRSTLTIAADGSTMHADWEHTDDGEAWVPWMDMDFTRGPAIP